jgi:hypothetical protein
MTNGRKLAYLEMFLVSIALSLICWLVIDTFIVDISYICSLILEFLFVGSYKLYNFIIRKVLGPSRT